jgi:cyclic pyranopterin phosphate synthase
LSKLTHFDSQGRAAMVDVSPKDATERVASAEAIVTMSEQAFALVISGEVKKGDVRGVARLAGIMAAKKTSDLIPLCHPLALSHIDIEIEPIDDKHALHIIASAKTHGPTGVEMEAMTAASVAALTIYDMVKAVDRSCVIETVRLLSKSGGKSGTFERPASFDKPSFEKPRK